MRVFIGIRPNASKRAEMVTRKQQIQAVLDSEIQPPIRWIDPADYHMTLRFIGQLEPERIRTVSDELKAVCRTHVSGSISLNKWSWLPSAKRPKVLCMEGMAPSGLQQLQQSIADMTSLVDVESSSHAYRPHISLARLGTRQSFGDNLLPVMEPLEFDYDQIALFKSDLSQEGARYTALAEFDLAAG